VNHRHLLFLLIRQGKKAAGLLLDSILQRVVDAVVDQIKEADVAGGVAQVGQKSRFSAGSA
jgi:hypothetical protein